MPVVRKIELYWLHPDTVNAGENLCPNGNITAAGKTTRRMILFGVASKVPIPDINKIDANIQLNLKIQRTSLSWQVYLFSLLRRLSLRLSPRRFPLLAPPWNKQHSIFRNPCLSILSHNHFTRNTQTDTEASQNRSLTLFDISHPNCQASMSQLFN